MLRNVCQPPTHRTFACFCCRKWLVVGLQEMDRDSKVKRKLALKLLRNQRSRGSAVLDHRPTDNRSWLNAVTKTYFCSGPHSPASVHDVSHSLSHNRGKVSSVHPIQSAPLASSTQRSSPAGEGETYQQAFGQSQMQAHSGNTDHTDAESNDTLPQNVPKCSAIFFEVRIFWFGGCVMKQCINVTQQGA